MWGATVWMEQEGGGGGAVAGGGGGSGISFVEVWGGGRDMMYDC